MKYRVKTKAKLGRVVNDQLKIEIARIDEIIEMTEPPTQEKSVWAIERLEKYKSNTIQFIEMITIEPI